MGMRQIVKDSTDQSIVIRIIDSTDGTPETAVEHNTAGIDLWYRREGAVQTSITEAALAALDSAHADGGIESMGHGYYRLDLPDAAVATGVNGVMIGGTVTGMIVIGCYIPLIDVDMYGVPAVNSIQISGSAPAADNVESVVLGTGHTDDVDLSARKLKLDSDTDVALEILSSNDSAIKAVSTASGKHGLELAGNVAGDGLQATGGSTGNGIEAIGGATSGAGIRAAAQNNNDAGMELVKNGTGKDLDADETDVIATLNTNLGTPANIDSGGATISDNLKKIADDNGGATFDATTDSLNKVRDNELTTISTNIGTPANIDSGGATIADNLKKIADDNAGATFDARLIV